MSETLEAIGKRCGTDKSSLIHDYLGFYEECLQRLRDQSFVLFEIGVYNGNSLSMWSEFFPSAKVVGIDIKPPPDTCKFGPNVSVQISDASRAETAFELIERFGRPSLVIDDGSHLWHHQIETLKIYWPILRHGGIYIMEDLHTSFPSMASEYKGCSQESAYDYLMKLNRWLVGSRAMGAEIPPDGFVANYHNTVKSTKWYRGTCVIEKR